ncbi:MAG: hypothetical protein ACC660_01850, partial [Acidimicrobiales bacterium]
QEVGVADRFDQIVLSDAGLELIEKVTPGSYTFVHGDLTEDDHDVFRERLILGDEGVVLATTTVDVETRSLVGGVVVESRGWLGGEHYDEVTRAATAELESRLLEVLAGKEELSVELLERRVRRTVGQFVNARTGRRPMIVPVVTLI